MAFIAGIAFKDNKRSPMKEVHSIEITIKNGLSGDFRGKGGITRNRQVTVSSVQQWEQVCRELDVSLPWHIRRSNLYVNGLVFGPEDVGKIICIDTFSMVELEITGETKPCKRMDEAHPGLKDALSVGWRGGVTCRVRKGGTIDLGSYVEFVRCH